MWVATQYDRVIFEQGGPMGEMRYDSADPPAGPLPAQARPLEALVGQEVRFEITPDGKIHRVEGFDKLVDDLVDAMDLPEGPARDMALETMRKSFNDESMRQMLGLSMGIYPDAAVAVGDSWDARQMMSVPFPMQIDTVYRLESVDDATATVVVEGRVEPGEGEGMQMGQGGEMAVKLTGSQSGTTVLDRDTGWATRVDLTQNMGGELTVTPPPGQGEAMVIPMKISGTTTIRPADEAGGGPTTRPAPGAIGGPVHAPAEAAE